MSKKDDKKANDNTLTKEECEKKDKMRKVVDKHIENIDKINLQVIAECLGADLKFYDVSYVSRRIIEIIQEAIAKANLETGAAAINAKVFFNDSVNKINGCVELKTYEDKESRENKCEPICKSVIGQVLSQQFFEGDSEWLDEYIRATQKDFVSNILKHYFEALFGRTEFSLEQSFNLAEKKLFGVDKPLLTLKMLDSILKDK